MKTIVKFLKNGTDIFAYFPHINYNEQLYGSQQKQSYSNEGHSACSVEYAQESVLATKDEYKDLLSELINIGYDDLEIINESFVTKQYENAYNIMYNKLIKEKLDFDTFTNKVDKWVELNGPKYGILNSQI